MKLFFSGERKLNNLVAELLEVGPVTQATAKLTVSDWLSAEDPGATFGQEQTFNFLEVHRITNEGGGFREPLMNATSGCLMAEKSMRVW